MTEDFGLSIWGNDDFVIDGDDIRINAYSRPSLADITKNIRDQKYSGPLLLRFPHLIKKQIDMLYGAFYSAREEFGYKGEFRALFPLKVNQFPNFVDSLISVSKAYGYGLEAGSKAELVIAMTKTPLGHPITVNGFKDKEMISLVFIAAKSGHNITVIIEGLGELETILEVHAELNADTKNQILPKIGMRVRLHSVGIGGWAKSGGYDSKFGLTSTEILEAHTTLQKCNLLEHFTMIHFHIGSQLSQIHPLKKALREAGNIYAELKQKGASGLTAINIGGGLAVEYSQHSKSKNMDYSLSEFANDVVFMMQEIANAKGVEQPDIYTESGRFIAASHSVLIAPVLELFGREYHQKALKEKVKNPPLIDELYDLLQSMNRSNAKEYLNDAIDHKESLLTLFNLGYIDLDDRSNTEILTDLIVKKYIELIKDEDECSDLESKIVQKYLINFSIFQSLPDFWGLGHSFPVMPITQLATKPKIPAAIWDITCDSDGEIPFCRDKPLYLHDVDLDKQEYFLAFFLTGAYQEILGMRHNLFAHPLEVVVEFEERGALKLDFIAKSEKVIDTIGSLGYDKQGTQKHIEELITDSGYIDDKQKQEVLGKISKYMNENGYLKTIQAIKKN